MVVVGLNKWIAGVAVAVLATAGAALLPSASASAATNLINNPGFESGTGSWTCSVNNSVVSTPVHSGTAALSGTPAGQDFAQCTQVVSVQPNSAYTLTGFVDGGYNFIGDTGTGTTDTSTFSQGSTSYTQLSTSFNTGASTTSVTIFVHGWYGQPTFFADDFTLTGPGGTVTVPSAPTGLKVTGTTSSSVSLSWTASSGATGYNVYRNGAKVGSATSTSFTDSGLASSTSFTYAVTATNSAGESAKSGTVQGTTGASGGNSGGALPAHILTGYWQDFTNGAMPLKLSSVPTTYDVIAVAFANATGTPGAVSFAVDSGLSSALGGYTDANFTSDVATVHSRGQKVIISVGGQNGTISVSDSTSASNFANSINSLMLGCDQNQAYSESTENFLTALACIQLQGGLSPSQVGLGLPANANGAGSGSVDPSVVNNALDCLDMGTNCGTFKPPSTWPGLRGAMDWSINWDASNGFAFANTVHPHLSTLK